jgi:hypothetical protein
MNEITLSEKAIQFKDNPTLIEAWLYMDQAYRRARELKAKLDQYIIEYCQQEGIKEINIDDRLLIKVAKKHGVKFKTDEIYDLLSFNEVQRQVLPKNPAFRKTELEQALGEDNLKEVMQVVFGDKLEVKEIDKKYLKQGDVKNGTGTTNS